MLANLDQQTSINTIRFLSGDMIQKPNSGHPGLPLDAAPMAYVLWTRFLKHYPGNPRWTDRDRFAVSAGHGSALMSVQLLHVRRFLSLGQSMARDAQAFLVANAPVYARRAILTYGSKPCQSDEQWPVRPDDGHVP